MRAAGDDVRLRVVHETRRGINNARNAGIASAAEGIVLLCDADDEVHVDWVRKLAEAVDEHHWAAGAVDYLSLNDPSTVEIWGAPPVGVPQVSDPYVDRTFGCSCGFLRSMWEEVGHFDPRLSCPTDENEFFMRAFAIGYRPQVVPEAVVAYRLRPGHAGWRRMRFLSGRGQGIAAGCSGGSHLVPLCRPPRSIWLLAKLLLVAPKYAWSPKLRHEWLGGVLRQWGRLIGWFSREGRTIRATPGRTSVSAANPDPHREGQG
jgi:glycosyltransferase involved in cell wall biosynthesis